MAPKSHLGDVHVVVLASGCTAYTVLSRTTNISTGNHALAPAAAATFGMLGGLILQHLDGLCHFRISHMTPTRTFIQVRWRNSNHIVLERCMLVCKLKGHDNRDTIIYKHFIGVGELQLPRLALLTTSEELMKSKFVRCPPVRPSVVRLWHQLCLKILHGFLSNCGSCCPWAICPDVFLFFFKTVSVYIQGTFASYM